MLSRGRARSGTLTIALLIRRSIGESPYDEPIKTLRGSWKMTGTQKTVHAISCVAKFFWGAESSYFLGSLDNPRITHG